MRIFRILPLLLALLVAAPVAADICDDINSLANDWNDVANTVHEYEVDGFTRSEARQADRAINSLLKETDDLGLWLEEEGNDVEADFGTELVELGIDLDEAESLEEMVDVMDDIVDELDALVDYCDE